MVAHAAYLDMIDTALPGLLLKPIEDPWDRFFVGYIDLTTSAYFAARATADLRPELTDYQELFHKAVTTAFDRIPSARLEYRSHGDLDIFLHIALPLVGNVLTNAAMTIGHFDALCTSIKEDIRLKNLLAEHGLLAWSKVYQHDLEANYDRRGQWPSARDFLSLTVHVERLLWQFGVFLWRTDENQIHVEIPIESDIAGVLLPSELCGRIEL